MQEWQYRGFDSPEQHMQYLSLMQKRMREIKELAVREGVPIGYPSPCKETLVKRILRERRNAFGR